MNLLKRIGTISEKDFVETSWKPQTLQQPPFPLIPRFPGYLISHGSACLPLPTTSADLTFNGDWFVFRNNNGVLDKDRYIVSASAVQGLVVYKTKPLLVPNHHVTPSDPVLKELSEESLKIVKEFIK